MENAILPLGPETSLEWIGFSDACMPLTYDSKGVLRGSFKNDSYRWIPLLDTRPLREGKQDYYWPVSTTEQSFHIVICKVRAEKFFDLLIRRPARNIHPSPKP